MMGQKSSLLAQTLMMPLAVMDSPSKTSLVTLTQQPIIRPKKEEQTNEKVQASLA